MDHLRWCALVVVALAVSRVGSAAAQEFPEARVARLEVRPGSVSVRVGERVPVEIVAMDGAGERVDAPLMRFTTRGAAAWYDERTSEILGLVPGEELVIARVRRPAAEGPGFDDVYGFVQVHVLPGAVDRIEVQDAEESLFRGTWTMLRAHAVSGDRRRDDVRITWTSSDPATVAVSPLGMAIAREVGDAVLTARADSTTVELPVRVIPNPTQGLDVRAERTTVRVGDVVHLTATSLDAAGAPVERAPAVRWMLLPGTDHLRDAAYVGEDGAFVAYTTGVHRVLATSGPASGLVEISAVPRPPRRTIRRLAHGVVPSGQATTDLWVFEGRDARDYVYTGTYAGNLMYAWDATDPTHPVITDSVAFDGRRVNDVKINADATVAVVTSENASNRRNGITLLDITNPAHPTKLAHFTDGLTGGVHNTWIEGDLVYAVHYGTQDMHILDISDPANPRRVGRWGLEKENKFLHDVNVVDGLAYLSYWDDGVVILDVGAGIAGGTPTAPTLVSQYKYQYQLGNDGQTYGNTHHAIRYGDYVFVGDEIFGCGQCVNGPRGYIHVLDVSDIRHPREVGYYRVPEAGSHNMWAEEDKLYIGYYQGGLRVVDISGELRGDLYRQEREIGWFMTEDATGTQPFATNTWGAQPYKGRIFASDGASGLWILEMEPAPAPVP